MSRSSVCGRAILEGGTGEGVEGWAGEEGRTEMDHPAAAPAADARFY